jgi:hypothetical protein
MPREEIVAYFEQYIERFKLPVQYGVRVTAAYIAAHISDQTSP